MRALLNHSCNHPKGNLKLEIPDPDWLADPSHRTKVVAKPIFALAISLNSKYTCTKVDAIRIKKDYEYMLKTNRMKTIVEIKFASKASIEHLFNNNEYCDSRWCRPNTILKWTTTNKTISESNEEMTENIKIHRTKN